MAEKAVLTARPRSDTGKGYARRARRAGFIPGVIYGGKVGSMNLELPGSELTKFVNSGDAGKLFDVELDKKRHTVLLKEVQKDPVRGELLHVDLHEVDLDKEIETLVAIQLLGEEKRESDGGIVTQNLRELKISCLPTNIPDAIQVDVSALTVGDSILVKALILPEGVKALDEEDEVVVSVIIPRVIEEKAEKAEVEGEVESVEAESTEEG